MWGNTRMIGWARCDRNERTNRPVTCLGPISSAFNRLFVTQSHSSGVNDGVRAPRGCWRRGRVISSMINGAPVTDPPGFDPRAIGHRYWHWSHDRYSSSEYPHGTSIVRIASEPHLGRVG